MIQNHWNLSLRNLVRFAISQLVLWLDQKMQFAKTAGIRILVVSDEILAVNSFNPDYLLTGGVVTSP